MTSGVLLIAGLAGILVLGVLILGILFIVAGGSRRTGGVSSARQSWMDSHVEKNEGER